MLEEFEMWTWREMEGTSWNDKMRNNGVLETVEEHDMHNFKEKESVDWTYPRPHKR